MPPLERDPWTFGAKAAVGVGAVVAVALAVTVPPVAAGLVGLYALGVLALRRRLNRMRAERAGDSICTFARAFNRRTVDPWVVRAVWDDVQGYVRSGGRDFPLRAGDDFERELSIDPGDIEEIARRSARRAGRSIAGGNALNNSLCTVGDLIHFLSAQPAVREA